MNCIAPKDQDVKTILGQSKSGTLSAERKDNTYISVKDNELKV